MDSSEDPLAMNVAVLVSAPQAYLQKLSIIYMSHPFLSNKTTSQPPASHSWTINFNTSATQFLKDHAFKGMMVVPGAAFIEAGLAGISTVFGKAPCRFSDISFEQMLLLSEEKASRMRLEIMPHGENTHAIQIRDSGTDARAFATFKAEVDYARKKPDASGTEQLDVVRERCTRSVSGKEVYERFFEE